VSAPKAAATGIEPMTTALAMFAATMIGFRA
jgi:hypothetical protein